MVREDKIAISEIFRSIDGEGFHSGQPTVFVRTFGCNLRCPWCFAKNTKGEYPYVFLSNGTKIRMDALKIGDKILTKDPTTNIIQECTVTNVMFREADKDSIRRIYLGRSGTDRFNVTGEHPFYTDRWIPIAGIREGEFVKRSRYADIVRFLVENTYRNDLTNYAKKAYETYCKNHGENCNFGVQNGMYSENCTEHVYNYVKYGLLEMDHSDYPVQSIWGKDNLVVHHMDGNHENDSLENLIVIPKRIHDQLHSRGNNFSKQSENPNYIELTYNRVRGSRKDYSNEVVNIETDTHSYLVNNENSLNSILVHNCDTKTTWTLQQHEKVYGRQPVWMTVEEIFNKVEELEKGFPFKSICLTGGEPLMEENKEFMFKLIKTFCENRYAVNVETNGAVDYSDYIELRQPGSVFEVKHLDRYGNRTGLSLITDWKLPASKMTGKMVESNLSILTEDDLIKCVITDDPEDWKEFERICKSGTKAKLYLSPCFGEVTMNRIPKFVVSHPEYNITAQIQIHKIFWDPNKVGV